MTSLSRVHLVCALLVGALALLPLLRAGHRSGRIGAWLCGVAALVTLVTGALRQPAWEPAYRRVVYISSRGLGLWLDRKTHVGVGACVFALALAVAAMDARTPRWLLRLLSALVLLLAVLAAGLMLVVRSRVPMIVRG